MDASLVISSKRDVRRYQRVPLPNAVVGGILEAGRVTGSGKNLQARRFIVVSDEQAAAEFVTRPDNVRSAALVVAVVVSDSNWAGFDAGRAAQSMMLWAWNEGVASCPNAIANAEGISAFLDIDASERVAVLLSFGLPPWEPRLQSKTVAQHLANADRLPLEQVVEYR